MTIDDTDTAPRPAHDFWARLPIERCLHPTHTVILTSLLIGAMKPAQCDQFGCDFSEFPHA